MKKLYFSLIFTTILFCTVTHNFGRALFVSILFILYSLLQRKRLLILASTAFIFCFNAVFAQTTSVTFTTSGSGAWTAPCNVGTVTVECWGGGGGGGNSNNTTTNGGSGGGGGAYAKGTHTVTSGSTYYYTIGTGGKGAPATSTTTATSGGVSWFNATGVNSTPASNTIGTLGTFGLGGVNNSLAPPTDGGLATSCFGNLITVSGSNGVAGAANGGGAGGAGAAPGGGTGGAGSTTTDGSSGISPGGGGGGGNDAVANIGGNGAPGQITITWSVGPPTITLGVNPIVVKGSTSANLPYTATTNSPTQYSITWDAAALAAGFVNVTNTALPASPIPLILPTAAVAVYNGTITVYNTITGCSSGTPFTVTVSYPIIEAFPNQTFCASTFTVATAYNTVNFSLIEKGATDFDASQTNATIIITLPAGFQFRANTGAVASNAVGTQDITIGGYTVTTTSITVRVTTAATQNNIDEINFTGIQIRATAAPSSGNVIRSGGTFKSNGSTSIPSSSDSFGHLATSGPSVYNSSAITQYTTSTVIRGCTSTSNPILEFKVNITGGLCTPNDVITSLTFSTTNSTAPATDITKAEVYYTDTAQGFSNANFFGSVTAPNGAFTITGSQGLNLGNGPYYFYLAYTVPATAVVGNILDASMTSFVFNATTYTNMATPSPAGSSTIVAGACPSAPDLSPPTSNTQTITAGSLIIPMDNAHQNIGSVFNIKAYGLVHALLQNDIPVKWVIKSGKAKDAADFIANAGQIYPTVVAAATQTFVASEFVVDSFYLDHSFYAGGLTATQVMTSFATPNNVAVYKLNTDVAVDVRYTLNHRPKIAVFSNGGYEAIQTTMLDAAGVTNYFVQNAGDFAGLAECYTFCSESHWAFSDNPDTRPVQRVIDFVNEGGNFLAQCAGIDLYENHQPTGEHFQTTEGVSFSTAQQTNTDYNPDMAFCQYQGQVASESGVIASYWLPTGSVYKTETYYGVAAPAVTNTMVASGVHLSNPDSVGSNVFYLAGHQYPYTTGAGGLTDNNGIRMYLNATLVPAGRPTAFPISLPANPTICAGQTVNIGPTCASGAIYAWSPSTALSSSTTCNPIASPTVTTSYNVVGFNGGCIMGPSIITVSVNPTPVMTSTNSATICGNGSVSIPLTSNLTSTYHWIASDNPNTTGESITTQTTSTLNNTIINTTTSVQTVIYTVTPTSTLGSCAGTPQIVTVTVSPAPTMSSASTATICASTAVNISLTANIAGSTFTWIATDNTNTTGESLSTQTTATLTDVITNTTVSTQNVIYTITPTAGGCPGTAQTVTIAVNPTPVMTSTTSATLCSGGTVSIPLTSNIASTYTWIATDNLNTTGESTSAQLTATLSNSIANSSAGSQDVIYSVIPKAGGCLGTTQTVTVTVNPTSLVTSAGTATICAGATVNIPLTSNVAGANFSWIATDNPNTTGESTTTQSSTTLSNAITNTTTSVQNVIYTVTPFAGACPGTPQTVTITVNPTPAMTSTNTATICSGATASITLASNVASNYTWIATDNINTTGESTATQNTATLSNTIINNSTSIQNVIYTVTPTSTGGNCTGTAQIVTVAVNPTAIMTSANTATICSGGTTSITFTSNIVSTYTWIATDNVNTTGESLSTQSTATLSNTITNNGTSAQSVIYTVTPSTGSCPGTSQTVTVTVNPIPTATATPASQTICSASATSIVLTSNIAGTTYSWTTAQSGVTGASNSSGSNITQTLTATSTSAGTVTYTITPTSTLGSCTGTPVVVTVTVNPIPTVTAAPTSQAFCSGNTSSIALTSGVAGATYSWTVSQTGVSGASSASGSSIAQTISTTGTATGTAVYTITPTAASCSGTAITATVTVNPVPAMTSANSATICTAATVSIPFTSNVASTYTWIASDNSNTTGESLTTQSTNTLSNAITNGTTVSQNVIYTVTPTSTGGNCAGTSQVITVQVNPVPTATATPSIQTICSASATAIALTSNIAGTTYSWTTTQSGVTGASNSSGSNITQTLTATSTSAGTVTYTITPANGCTGTPIIATITVNPIPTMTSANTATICSGATASITLASNVASTYTWIATDNTNTTGESLTTQTTNILSNIITNNTTSAQNVIYTITPTSTGGSCTGVSQTVTVTVNPTPSATATPSSQTICSTGTTSIALTSNIAGTTYAWTETQVGVSGASSSSGSSITQTLTATTTSAGTATYTITPTSTLGSCAGSTLIVPITVNPIPTITTTPTSQAFCSGNTTSIALTSGVTGTTYSWTVTQTGVSGATSASGSSIAQTISTTGTATGTAVYTITPTASSCSGTPITATVTVNPVPAMTSASSATICTAATVSIPLTSNVASTYTWIAADNTNTTGESLTAQSTTTLSNTITNGTAVSQNVIYTVTPTSTGGSCVGAAQTVTVEVNPVPTATATPSTQTICSAGATSIALTSNIAGTTYSWTTTQSGVTGASNSSGSNITQTLTATGTSPGTVTYTITPANGCTGSTIVVTVTVNPTPAMTSASAATICSGGTASINLTSNVVSTYTWIAANNANTTGESTTTQSTNTLSNVITNNTTSTQPVIYTVTPTSTGGSCVGAAQTVTVTVNPIPTATATPASQTICSTGATSIALTSNIAGTTCSWTVSQSGESGASSSSGANITQNLTTTSTSAGTATYTITPTFGACPGAALIVPITVNPIPTVTATPTSQAFCSGNTSSIALTSGVVGATYSWTVSQTGVSGASALSGSSIAQTISTTGASQGTAIYTITPTASSCSGTATTATVTVNPIPSVTSAGTATICSNGTVNIPLTSNVTSAYTWIATNNPNTTGESITTQTTSTLNNTIISTTGNTETVIYTVTPTSTGGSCAGVAQTVSVTISPTPIVTITPTSQIFCSGNATSIALTSNVTGTIFNWTDTQSGVSGASASSGSSITQTLTTTGTSLGTVVYTITPTIGTCTGTSATATVIVNPVPSATATPSSQSICSGSATSIALTSNVAATTYSWTVSQSGVSGATSASGSSIAQTLTTVGTTSGTATYTITPSTASCPGTPIVVTVTVNPVPSATATPATQALCSGSTTSIALTSNVTGTTFSWTDSQSGASGASASSGSTITQTLTATGASQGIITYTITPLAGTCNGSTTIATVTVNPIPVAPTVSSNSPVCISNTITFSVVTVAGATYSWSGPNSYTANVQNPSITNAALTDAGTYSVNVTVNGCTGPNKAVNVAVNPPPPSTVAVNSNSPVCTGQTLTLSTPTVTSASYSWIGPNTFTSSIQNPSINNVALAANGTYTVTATVPGCGLSGTGTVSVVVNPTPVAPTASNNGPLCVGATLTLTASNTGTTYSWTGPNTFTSTTQNPSKTTITSADAGVYSVTATSLGCTSTTGTTNVIVNPIPATPTVTSNSPLCVGQTLNLSTSAVGGASYSWTGPNSYTATTQNTSISNVAIINGGTYSLAVTVSACTSATGTVDVAVNSTPVTPTATVNNPVCVGDTLFLSASSTGGASYNWTGPNTFTANTQNPTITGITAAVNGTYTVIANNGCASAPATVTVAVSPTPAAPIAGSNSPLCVGSTLNLTATNTSATYNWSGPNTFTSSVRNPNIINVTSTEAGVYSVTATSTVGCVSPTATVNVVINSPAIVSANGSQTVCANNSAVTLNGSSSTGAAQWSSAGTGTFTPNNTTLNALYTPSTTEISAGTATLTLSSLSNGACTAVTDQMVITITPSPTVSTSGSQTVCANNSQVTLNGTFVVASGISWSTSGTGTFTPDNVTPSTTYSPSAADISAGTTTLTITSTGNGNCLAVTNTMVVTINPSPIVNGGADIFVCSNNVNAALSGASSTGAAQWSTSGTGTFTPNNTTLNATYVSSPTDISGGVVTLTLTSTNNVSCLAVADTLTIKYTPPPTVNAGTLTSVCANNSAVTLNGTSSTGSGSWITSGTGTFTPDNNTLNATYNASAADATAGTVTFTLSSTNNGGCIPVTSAVTVTITPSPTASAGTDQSVCANNASVTLTGSVTVASGGTWSSLGTGTFTPDNTSMSTTYIPSNGDTTTGSVKIILTTSGNGNCNATTDTILVTITNAPHVSAGADANVCLSNPNHVLTGSSSTGSATWSTLGTGTFTPNNTTLNATYVPSSSDTTGKHVTLILTSGNNNGCNAVTDTMKIVYTTIPTISTGTGNQTVCGNNANVILSGSSSTGTGAWASSGTGTFTPNNTTLNGTYIPSSADTATGNVTLTITSSGGCAIVTQTISVTITDAPGVTAGTDVAVCANNATVTLNGNVSGATSTGIWSTIGTGTFTPDNTTLNATYAPSSADTTAGSVIMILTSSGNGSCKAATDTMKITYTHAPHTTVGGDAVACANNAVALSGTISGGTGSGVWTTTNGNGTFTPSNTALNSSYNAVSADATGTNVMLVLTSTNNGGCLASSDTMYITVNPGPVVNAGTDQTMCANNISIALSGTVAVATGGQWSSLGTGTFTPSNTDLNASYNPTATEISSGVITLVLTSTGNGLCQAVTDTMKVNLTPAPKVNAGADIFICNSSTVTALNGSVSGGSTTGQWTTLGTGTFTPNDNTLNATYNLSPADTTAGIVKLVLTSTNNLSCNAVTDTVVIKLNSAPNVFAGNDTTVCGSVNTIALNGSVSGGIIGHWTTHGNGTFAPNDSTLNATYNVGSNDISAGSVVLTLTSNVNGQCSAAVDSVKITFSPATIVNAGANISVCSGVMTTQLNGVVSGGSTSGMWTTLGNGTFTPNDTTLNAVYNLSTADTTAGSVKLVLTSTHNGACSTVSDTVIINKILIAHTNAGNDTSVCGNNTAVQLHGNVIGGSGLGKWTTSAGTGAFTPNDSTLNATYLLSAGDAGLGSVTLTLSSIQNGSCPQSVDSMKLTITPIPIVNAGSNIAICNGAMSVSLNGNVTGGTTTGIWNTLGSGTFTPNDSTLNATYNLSVADSTAGNVSLILTSTHNGSCSIAKDTVLITLNSVPVVSVGNDTSICSSVSSVQLHGAITGGSSTGLWTTTGTGTFTPNDSTVNATYQPSAADAITGNVTITLASTHNCVNTSDSLKLAIMLTPVVNAGSNISICNGAMSTVLNGTVSGGTSTGIWNTLGSGTFAPNDSTLNATYNLSVADSTTGHVSLILTSTHNGSCSIAKDTVLITLNSTPVVSVGNDTSICSNTNSVTLHSTITGGTGTGQWTSNGTGTFTPNDSTLNAVYTPSAADVTVGTVTLTLTSTHNCVNKADSLKLTIQSAPLVNAGANIAICNGVMSAPLSGTVTGGAGTAVWSTLGSGTFTPNDTTLNSTYNLSVADSTSGSVSIILTSTHNGGCSVAADTVLITINPNTVTFAGHDTTVCSGTASVQLHGTVSGSSATGIWSTAGTGTFTPDNTTLNTSYAPSASDITNGNVALVLTSTNNCVNTNDTMKITFAPTATVSAGRDTSVCSSNVIVLNGSVTTGSIAHWSTIGTGTFTPNDSTLNATYIPAITDNDTLTFVLALNQSSSCGIASDTVVVHRNGQPIASFSVNNVCIGQTVSFTDNSTAGGGSISTWHWSFGTGDTSATKNPTYTYTTSGTYTVHLVVSAGGNCKDSVAKTVNIHPVPVPGFTLTANCMSDSAVFTNSSTISQGSIASWSWSFGDGKNSGSQNPHHLYDSLATYTVSLTAVSDSGCSASTSHTLTVHPSPLAGFAAQSNCLTLMVNFKDTSKVILPDTISSYNWTFGDGGASVIANPLHSYSASGTYTVLLQVQNSNGCKDTATKVITTGQPIVAQYIPDGGSYNVHQNIDFTSQTTGANTYNWNFGDNSTTSTLPNPTHDFNLAGTYTVMLIASNSLGCSDTVRHTFDVNPSGHNVPTGFTPNGDGLNDYFYIMGGPFSQYDLRVFNEWGQQIFMSNNQSDKWDGTFGGTKQPAGTYMYIFNASVDGKSLKLSGEINLIQ